MKKILHILRFLLFLPLVLLVVSLTIGNLHEVSITLYPFDWVWQFPLIFVLYISFAAGVISALLIGAMAKMRTKMQGASLKRELRHKERDLKKAQNEIEKTKVHREDALKDDGNLLITKS